MKIGWLSFAFLCMLPKVAFGVNASANVVTAAPTSQFCVESKHVFNPFTQKKNYTVGVHAIRGLENAYEETYRLFGTYLTETAGKTFDPPIVFHVVPVLFDGIFEGIKNNEMDFFYANPGVYSCVGIEVGAAALGTAVKRLQVRDETYDLDVYGGVIATRADNKDVNSIEDLKDKIIGAGAIIDLMAGQMQIYEMEKNGMSYVNDPKQVVFTKNQIDVVNGVLDGTFDVGFIRTDQIEITTDAHGKLLDPKLFKIVEPKIYVMDDGDLFPFLHSTDIFPEWPFAALAHIDVDVVYEVQKALLDVGHYAAVGAGLANCKNSSDASTCTSKKPTEYYIDAPCDTTWPLAELAYEATEAGHFAGFRPSRTYFALRTMQQRAGFLEQDEEGDWFCTRPSNLYEGITCPEGFYKRSEDEFWNGCEQIGLKCDKAEYDCFCKPCVRAFDVDVYQQDENEEDLHIIEHYGDELPGCEKMSICGTVQQGDSITLRIYDNVLRENAVVKVVVHAGDEKRELTVTPVPGADYAYEFTLTDTQVQVQVIEVFVNDQPISQSPIRVEVISKDCDALYGESSKREADEEGNCVCENNTYEMGSTCVESHFFFLIIFSCVFAFLGFLVCIFLSYKKQQSDSVWHVGVEELHFNEPPEVIGQGAFGVVVLGQYRGTKVAVKRVLPPTKIPRHKRGSTAGSIQASGSITMSAEIGRKKTKEQKNVDDKEKAVQFDKKGEEDPEAPAPKNLSGNLSSKAWEDLLFDDNKYGNPLKILESATLSNHGSDSFIMASASKTSQYFLELLPAFMRFDEHTRLKREFVNEMRLLSRLRHPCITTVMGAVIAPRVDPMLVMEYMEYGSLYDLLRNETMYAGGEIILQIIRDITQGIQFLHASKPPILHGDLKAKNILVDARFRAKVADFGFSHFKTAKAKNVLQGTPFFMAPEYLRRKSEYTSACDIYSLGMIFYEIYARQDPFEGEDPRKILPKVCHPRVNKRPPVPESCPPKIADIMKKCWSANAFFRPSAKDIDYILVEMNSKEAEPLETIGQEKYKENMTRRPTSLYDVFPKHIADALNAGKRVEPESHEIVTVVFSDIVGFTDISQTFTALKVANMLDRLYQAFDELARKHSVFKVETIGDAYMGVTNLDGSQFDSHVKQIADFAVEAIDAASKILIDEDAPERGFVQIRVGFHSGPVVSNVIGSLNPRYGLFGDTVNTASRMETNSQAGRVHCTYASAKLLETQAPEIPVTLRGKIHVKGKGKMMTYWVGKTDRKAMETIPDLSESPSDTDVVLDPDEANKLMDSLRDLADGDDDEASVKTKDTEWSSLSGSQPDSQSRTVSENTERKIDAVFDVLLSQLKNIVASRPETAAKRSLLNDQVIKALEKFLGADTTMLEEADEFKYLEIPDGNKTGGERDPDSMALDSVVQNQLHQFVEVVASMHNANPFHSFDHAVHVAKSANRLIARTNSLAEDADVTGDDKTFGLAGDKLAQFAVVFSALIHDLDHQGIPNFCLAKEDPEMNERFHGKALAEQHSFELGWELFMRPEYDALRASVYVSKEELIRFRHLVIKSIIATEIFDPDLAKQRLDRWNEANDPQQAARLDKNEARNRKATVALEHLIQTSDVAHTMQSWNVYLKWNQNLFKELYLAYHQGRFPHNPADTWYEGEMKFFDTYVIPLATRLQECEAFGPSSSDYLKYAKKNRRKWEEHGKTVVENMTLKIETDDKLNGKEPNGDKKVSAPKEAVDLV